MRFFGRSALLFLALVSATVAQEPLSFIHQIRTASSTVCIPFGTAASVIDVRIDWGDTVQQNVSTRVQCNIYTWGVEHVYSNAGNYTVTISAGSGASPWLPWFGHASLSSTVELDILDLLSFGGLGTTSFAFAFLESTNMRTIPRQIPPTVVDISYMLYSSRLNSINISLWDVSNISRMDGLFAKNEVFNRALDAWNTVSLTSMASIFEGASTFYRNISGWNVASVTNMDGAFASTSFNGIIAGWDVSSVTSMDRTFKDAIYFNSDISSWNVGNVRSFFSTFWGAKAFNQTLSGWDTSSATSMENMFTYCTFNQPISTWDVSKVTNMRSMFAGNTAFNQPLDNWNVSSLRYLNSMFSGASAFNQPLNSWNTSLLTNLEFLFNSASSFNQPLVSWDVSSVTSLSNTFNRALNFNQNISSWNTRSVVMMQAAFAGASSFNQPLNAWNVSKVTEFTNMFSGTTDFNQPLYSWDVTKATTMVAMFESSNFNQSLSQWCVPEINSTPLNFSPVIPSEFEPRWGCAVPVLTASPVSPPAAISCGTPPQGAVNVSCADGVLTYDIPTCEFFGSCSTNGTSGASGQIVIKPRTQAQLIGNATISNATISVQVSSGTGNGLVIASGCVNITGQIQVVLNDPGAVSNGDTVLFLRLDRPECSSDGLNDTVIVSTQGDADNCRVVSATKRREQSSPTSQSLVILFSVTSKCTAPDAVAISGLSPALIGGIAAIVVVAVAALIVVVVVLLVRKARKRKEKSEELQQMYNNPA